MSATTFDGNVHVKLESSDNEPEPAKPSLNRRTSTCCKDFARYGLIWVISAIVVAIILLFAPITAVFVVAPILAVVCIIENIAVWKHLHSTRTVAHRAFNIGRPAYVRHTPVVLGPPVPVGRPFHYTGSQWPTRHWVQSTPLRATTTRGSGTSHRGGLVHSTAAPVVVGSSTHPRNYRSHQAHDTRRLS